MQRKKLWKAKLFKRYYGRRIIRLAEKRNISLEVPTYRRIGHCPFSLRTRIERYGQDIRVANPLGMGVEDILYIRTDGTSEWQLFFP